MSASNADPHPDQFAHSFAPIENPKARVLILGSMPGVASLRAGQYYAHPRNQFWPIMAALLNIDLPALPYAQRVIDLTQNGIALWDVLKSCQRPGSLDADIAPETAIANEIAPFFARHRHLTHVFFNGAAAEKHYNRQVRRRIAVPPFLSLPTLQFQRLPSTSPAHAAQDFSEKLATWRTITDILHRSFKP